MLPTALHDASLCFVHVGILNTRAYLFERVDDRYHCLAHSKTSTTMNLPYHQLGLGVLDSIRQIQSLTGRILLNDNQTIHCPSREDGTGVDRFLAAVSMLLPLKAGIIGVNDAISTTSAERLAQSFSLSTVYRTSMNDRRSRETRVTQLVHENPEVILITGGFDDGSSQALLPLLQELKTVFMMTTSENRPCVLFAGNQKMKQTIHEIFSPLTKVSYALNIRPALDDEDFTNAQHQLSLLIKNIYLQRIPALATLDQWSEGKLAFFPTIYSRALRYLSLNGGGKNILGVNLDDEAVTSTLAMRGKLVQKVFTPYCAKNDDITEEQLQETAQWLYARVSLDEIRNYLYTKNLYPGAIAITKKELAIEQAFTCSLLRKVSREIQQLIAYNKQMKTLANEQDEAYQSDFPIETIIASGNYIMATPEIEQRTLLLLDGLQPKGFCMLYLDEYQILPALGACAAVNTVLAAQVLETQPLTRLGVIIAPESTVPDGRPILRIRIITENGIDVKYEVNKGDILRFPLLPTQLYIKPLQGTDLGFGVGVAKRILFSDTGGKINQLPGCKLGIIIDARGRPFSPPKDFSLKREKYRRWIQALKG